MKIKIFILFLLIVIGGMAMWYDGKTSKPTIHNVNQNAAGSMAKVPHFSLTTLDQKTYAITDLPEQGILLHFWASWCPPCLTELPVLLQRIADANGRLALVAVSIDRDDQAMRRFMDQHHGRGLAHVYWVWDADKAISFKLFNTTTPPETILINGQRHMVEKIVGDPGWNSAELKEKLNDLVHSSLRSDWPNHMESSK